MLSIIWILDISAIHCQDPAVRLAELCRRSGVPRSTIKFYLREGMLPAGEPRAKNQAEYADRHLERLALIRVLREVTALPLEVIARVTKELDRGWGGGDPVGEALVAIYAPPARQRSSAERAELARVRTEVDAFLAALPWATAEVGQNFAGELADVLLQVRRHLFPDFPAAALAPYAEVAWLLSEVEFAHAPGGARVPIRARGDALEDPTRRAILGTVLFDRVFSALRRYANAARSVRTSEAMPVPPAPAPRRPRRRA
jgi:DNA-binding transcriptional MerR regulator